MISKIVKRIKTLVKKEKTITFKDKYIWKSFFIQYTDDYFFIIIDDKKYDILVTNWEPKKWKKFVTRIYIESQDKFIWDIH